MSTLFYGGRILTMSDPLYVESVLVEDGKILAVGKTEELRANAPGCCEVDLHGHTLMPGFIDPHSHFFQVATSLLRAPVGGLSEVSQIRDAIQGFIAQNNIAPGQWVNARDYDNNIMPDLKNPTIEELDSFAPDNPLVIHFKSGHMGLMNSRAFRELGITAETSIPEGGKIEVVNGKLTGYLEENIFFDCLKKIPMADTEQLLHAFSEAQKLYASYGITTVQDGMVVSQMLPMYRVLLEKNMLNLDVILYSSPEDYSKTKKLLAEYPENRHLKCGGMKIFLDGSPQGRTAWMREPYADESEYAGYPTMSDDAVRKAFAAAARENTQIIAHCNGDAAAAQFLRCLEEEEKVYPNLKYLRPVIIHGQLMGTDQLSLVKKLGAAISYFVAHVYHWGDVHIRNFGMKRASGISPACSAMKEGIHVTFHQDAPVINPDMIETVWCAVNRTTKNGILLGPEERISTLEAIRAVTVNAAYQYGEENRKGIIAKGMDADFVVLDKDLLESEPSNLRDNRVLAAYKAGTCIYRK